MATDEPLTRIVLAAGSVADDLGYVALADLSRMLGARPGEYRVIGGHMVTALAARWELAGLYRETGDADVGVPPIVAQSLDIASRLAAIGYRQVAGDRFEKSLSDVPVTMTGRAASDSFNACIDVLIPAYTSRARQNVTVGGSLVATEVPGLAVALARAPLSLELELHRLNGETLTIRLSFPDEASALALKGLATRVRSKATDVVDVWRCLEIGLAAGVKPGDFAAGVRAESAAIVRALFERRDGPGMTALIGEQHLGVAAADQRHTRIRALMGRVLGPD